MVDDQVRIPKMQTMSIEDGNAKTFEPPKLAPVTVAPPTKIAAPAPAAALPALPSAGSLPTLNKAAPGLSLMDAATTYNATTGGVSNDETVNSQLTRLLDANSVYVDQARQRAMQMANSRGLQNSSLAASAGEEAAIAQALPIAQQDASTFSRRASENLGYQNRAGEFNAGAGLNLRQMGENARQFDNNADLSRSQLGEQQRQFDGDASLRRAGLGEQQRQFDTDAELKRGSLFEQQRQFNAELAQKGSLAQLDADTRSYLANTEAQYKTLMQSSASASEMWKTYTDSLQKVLNNKDLDAPNKQKALDMLGQQLRDGMNIIGSISNMDLGSILQFAPGSATPGAPPPPPTDRPGPDIPPPDPWSSGATGGGS